MDTREYKFKIVNKSSYGYSTGTINMVIDINAVPTSEKFSCKTTTDKNSQECLVAITETKTIYFKVQNYNPYCISLHNISQATSKKNAPVKTGAKIN